MLGTSLVRALFIGLIVSMFCLHDSVQAEEGKKPLIVCSTTQVADFTRQVVGDDCRVVGILAPGSDPHLYEPRPGDARLVATADLCIENGLHLEGHAWMAGLARNAGKPLVTAAAGVKPLILEAEGEPVNDPHAWFTPANAVQYVNNILDAVIKIDPERADNYRARAQLYADQLRALHSWIVKQISVIPPDHRVLVTSHDAFNYYCAAYGLKAAAPVGWSTGEEAGGGMTPERRRMVVESIQQFNVPAIFVETSVNPKMIREIAVEAGVDIGGELYSDSMGPADSAGETYIGMMRENTIQIRNALSRKTD